MTDTADTATTTTDETTTETETTTTGGTPDLEAEVEKWKKLSKKHEDRAKANASAVTELEALKQQTMTDTEKAVEQARSEARAAALAEVGSKVARAEVRAVAAGRLDEAALDTLLDGIDLGKFLDADGEVDTEKVRSFIDGIAPKTETQQTGTLDLGQGSRGAGSTTASDPLLSTVKRIAGVR